MDLRIGEVFYSGKVTHWNVQKGYGFISCDATYCIYGKDIFFSRTEVLDGPISSGAKVNFSVHNHWTGPYPSACNVVVYEWLCPCGFVNKSLNKVCGGIGPLGCKQPRPEKHSCENEDLETSIGNDACDVSHSSSMRAPDAFVDVDQVDYGQASISDHFRDGISVFERVVELLQDPISTSFHSIPPIKVSLPIPQPDRSQSVYVAFDNRRLFVFKTCNNILKSWGIALQPLRIPVIFAQDHHLPTRHAEIELERPTLLRFPSWSYSAKQDPPPVQIASSEAYDYPNEASNESVSTQYQSCECAASSVVAACSDQGTRIVASSTQQELSNIVRQTVAEEQFYAEAVAEFSNQEYGGDYLELRVGDCIIYEFSEGDWSYGRHVAAPHSGPTRGWYPPDFTQPISKSTFASRVRRADSRVETAQQSTDNLSTLGEKMWLAGPIEKNWLSYQELADNHPSFIERVRRERDRCENSPLAFRELCSYVEARGISSKKASNVPTRIGFPVIDSSGSGYVPKRFEPGDWICPCCGDHQFARNSQCRICGASKFIGTNPIRARTNALAFTADSQYTPVIESTSLAGGECGRDTATTLDNGSCGAPSVEMATALLWKDLNGIQDIEVNSLRSPQRVAAMMNLEQVSVHSKPLDAKEAKEKTRPQQGAFAEWRNVLSAEAISALECADREIADRIMKYLKDLFKTGRARNPSAYVLRAIEKESRQSRVCKLALKPYRNSKSALVDMQSVPIDAKTLETISSSFFYGLCSEQAEVGVRALRSESVFITGAAGTGKSILLKQIAKALQKLHGESRVGVTASTGTAALGIGGQTLHSLTGIGLGKGRKEEILRKILQGPALDAWLTMKVLIIDEISLVDAEIFDLLEFLATSIRQASPFGGVQLVLCGDFAQLPPVCGKKMCFESHAWGTCSISKGTVILKQVHRQSSDSEFLEILHEVRLGHCSDKSHAHLLACALDKKLLPLDGIEPTQLYCSNADVDRMNQHCLAMLPGDSCVYDAIDTFTQVSEHFRESLLRVADKLLPRHLVLKVGAQVVLTRNLTDKLVNGSRGIVTHLGTAPIVRFDCGELKCIEPTRCSSPSADGGWVSRKQFPLQLAWAMTIHRSQGMTLTRAILMLENAWAYGQVYVALSRVTSLSGLWLKGCLPQAAIRADPKVVDFYRSCDS